MKQKEWGYEGMQPPGAPPPPPKPPRHKHPKQQKGGLKRFGGMLVLLLVVAAVVVLPAWGSSVLLQRLTGWNMGVAVVLLGGFLWLALLYGIVMLTFRLAHLFIPHQHGPGSPRNRVDIVRERKRGLYWFSQVEQALDSIANGDFDVFVELNQRDYLNRLGHKINRMAQQLASMETMRQDFVANVSHEIQSPLTSIRGFATLLKNPDVPDARRQHYIQVIETETERLSKLCDNLLKLSMLDSGDTELAKQPYPLHKQLQDVLLLLEPQWQAKKLEVSLTTPHAVEVTANKDMLEQVWVNLVYNAIKFTPQGGQVTVALDVRDGFALCRVQDTGIGIEEESQIHVFERFYKADKSRDRALGGSGLGLSLVKRIVELHGGIVHLQSTPGKGSCFTVELPLKNLENPAANP